MIENPNNPRFPFTLKVYRPRKDANGEFDLDASGKPTFDLVTLDIVAMNDGWAMRNSDGSLIIEKQATEIKCGYRTNTRNLAEMGDVVVYNITLHTPPFTTPLYFDDILEVTDYERTFRAKMVKKVTFNWGTDIWYDEIRN